MCTSTPDIPVQPQRQQAKLPDQGTAIADDSRDRIRRALQSGVVTSMQGTLGSPRITAPKLGVGA